MSLKERDPLIGPSRGTPEQALAYVRAPTADDRAFVAALHRWSLVAGIDFAPVMAWAFVETADLTSPRYTRDRNPAGIAIPAADTVQPFVIPDYDAAARLMVQCWFSIVAGRLRPDVPLWPAATDWMERVWIGRMSRPGWPGVRTLGDLDTRWPDPTTGPNATWAWGHALGQPAAEAVRRGNLAFPGIPDSGGTGGTPPMPTITLPIRQGIIPAGNRNRPGTKLTQAPLLLTIHETGNPSVGANAEMHRVFVRGGGGQYGVSFHFAVDSREAVQLLPLDEIGYHAGDGCDDRATDLGCFQSVAIETCVNADGDWAATKRNLVALCAAIIGGDVRIDFAGRRGQFAPSRLAQHQRWSGKNCPMKIRAEGSWQTLLGQIAVAAGGATPPPPPAYAEPDIPTWLQEIDPDDFAPKVYGGASMYPARIQFTATADIPRRRFAGGNEVIGPPIRVGESFVSDALFAYGGRTWAISRWGTRVDLSHAIPKVSIA